MQHARKNSEPGYLLVEFEKRPVLIFLVCIDIAGRRGDAADLDPNALMRSFMAAHGTNAQLQGCEY